MNFFLFNKTYLGDFKRTLNLCKSIEKYNVEDIPLYISAPAKDLNFFRENISTTLKINWVSDEEIILVMPDKNLEKYYSVDGYISQQVVKSEVWRLFVNNDSCRDVSYLCLDADSEFIKDFYLRDFIAQNGTPYTVMHQNKELMQLAHNKKILKVPQNFHHDCERIKLVFDRFGPDFDFGIPPVVWSSKVWRDLYVNYLLPNGMTFWDAINLIPTELRWYGEALLKYQSIRLIPIEPLFRAYHYDWQFFSCRRQGETVDKLTHEYLGFVRQSNWFYESDYGDQALRKSYASRLLRQLKRFISRFR